MTNYSDELSRYFYYDESSPSYLRWKVNRTGGRGYKVTLVKEGDVAGYLKNAPDGYYRVNLLGKSLLVHRIIVQLSMDTPLTPELFVDHIDGERKNNVLSNLRVVSRKGNNRNKSKRENNWSGTTGVSIRNSAKGGVRCIAHWKSLEGKNILKSFSESKYGIMVAYKLAVVCRSEAINTLNQAGAGYSTRHGL